MSGKIKIRRGTETRRPSDIDNLTVRKAGAATVVVAVLGWIGSAVFAAALVGILIYHQGVKRAQLAEQAAAMQAAVAAHNATLDDVEARKLLAREVFSIAVADKNEVTKELNLVNRRLYVVNSQFESAMARWQAYKTDLDERLAKLGVTESDPEALRQEKVRLTNLVQARTNQLQATREISLQKVAVAARQEKLAELEKKVAQDLKVENEKEKQKRKAEPIEVRKYDFEFKASPVKTYSRVDGTDYDNRSFTLRLNWSLRNRHNKRVDFENFTLQLMAYGELTYAKAYQVILTQEFNFSCKFLETVEDQTQTVTVRFDNNAYAKFGAEYEGYLGMLKDGEGRVVYVFGSSSRLTAKYEKVMGYGMNFVFDKNGEESDVQSYSSYYLY